MFLEKTKLKDDSSNDADWVHDPRINLIAAQKNYVLDAPLGDGPIAGAYADVIRLQRIYNFWLFHAIILSVLDVLYAFICYFILFLGLTY